MIIALIILFSGAVFFGTLAMAISWFVFRDKGFVVWQLIWLILATWAFVAVLRL